MACWLLPSASILTSPLSARKHHWSWGWLILFKVMVWLSLGQVRVLPNWKAQRSFAKTFLPVTRSQPPPMALLLTSTKPKLMYVTMNYLSLSKPTAWQQVKALSLQKACNRQTLRLRTCSQVISLAKLAHKSWLRSFCAVKRQALLLWSMAILFCLLLPVRTTKHAITATRDQTPGAWGLTLQPQC